MSRTLIAQCAGNQGPRLTSSGPIILDGVRAGFRGRGRASRVEERILTAPKASQGIRKTAEECGVNPSTPDHIRGLRRADGRPRSALAVREDRGRALRDGRQDRLRRIAGTNSSEPGLPVSVGAAAPIGGSRPPARR
jgi:hypothetical protein